MKSPPWSIRSFRNLTALGTWVYSGLASLKKLSLSRVSSIIAASYGRSQ